MLTRICSIIAVSAALAPWSLWAQVVEEDEVEILQPLLRVYQPEESPDLSRAAERAVAMTNRFREQEHLSRVVVNPQLQTAAQGFADYMARTLRFGHKADGSRPADRAQKAGYEYCIVAENIAYEYSSTGFTSDNLADRFFEGWKASPGHRRNMLDPDVMETALAIAQGDENGYFFAVQMFGRPRSKAVEFNIANDAPATVEYQMGDRTFLLEPSHIRTHQVCRPRDLTFRWKNAKTGEQLVHPSNGDRFVVTKVGENLSLQKR